MEWQVKLQASPLPMVHNIGHFCGGHLRFVDQLGGSSSHNLLPRGQDQLSCWFRRGRAVLTLATMPELAIKL